MTAGGGGISVSFTIDDAAVLAALRAMRRDINQDVKKSMLDAAKAVTLPAVVALTAPSRGRMTMAAKATTRGAYITTNARGELRKVIGLLNFGGTVEAKILPKTKKALFFGGDHPVASISTPRHYRGKHFIEKGIQATLGRFSAHVERQLTKIMQGRLTHAGTF
ncbi:MAG: hypothetical protein H0W82_00015 [Actinobacteria bacterium]|nr:hypothetical protein [Actinomycetota bacterium]